MKLEYLESEQTVQMKFTQSQTDKWSKVLEIKGCIELRYDTAYLVKATEEEKISSFFNANDI